MLNPDAVFSILQEVRDHPELSKKQKIEILRSWAYNISENSVAEEEGMTGKNETVHLDEILTVLHEIGATNDA